MVSTKDSESFDPSSSLGRTLFFKLYSFFFLNEFSIGLCFSKKRTIKKTTNSLKKYINNNDCDKNKFPFIINEVNK